VENFHVGPFTIQDQHFNLIQDEVGYSFEKLPLEGIVGLGFPSMSSHGEVPFFDNVIRQGLLEHNEFAFYVSDQEDALGSSIFWGGVDPDVYTGKINMFPVTQAHYWAVDLHALHVGSEKLDIETGSTIADGDEVRALKVTEDDPRLAKLIVDTGTTYITAGPMLREAISRRLPDGDCDEVTKYPHIIFTLQDVRGDFHELDLSPREYMASSDGGQACELSLMELSIPPKYGPGMVVGELFMRRYFTVFDRGSGLTTDARVGFARARHQF
jgi:pepsin A